MNYCILLALESINVRSQNPKSESTKTNILLIERNGVVLDRQLRSGQTAYGEANVQQLAFENPALAANNADSYRVFFDGMAPIFILMGKD
jgi:hypothetical protein